MFGTADPFGSNSFGSKAGGFADFSQMSKVRGAGCYRNKSPLFSTEAAEKCGLGLSFCKVEFTLFDPGPVYINKTQ